jgi:hypothetical protein
MRNVLTGWRAVLGGGGLLACTLASGCQNDQRAPNYQQQPPRMTTSTGAGAPAPGLPAQTQSPSQGPLMGNGQGATMGNGQSTTMGRTGSSFGGDPMAGARPSANGVVTPPSAPNSFGGSPATFNLPAGGAPSLPPTGSMGGMNQAPPMGGVGQAQSMNSTYPPGATAAPSGVSPANFSRTDGTPLAQAPPPPQQPWDDSMSGHVPPPPQMAPAPGALPQMPSLGSK